MDDDMNDDISEEKGTQYTIPVDSPARTIESKAKKIVHQKKEHAKSPSRTHVAEHKSSVKEASADWQVWIIGFAAILILFNQFQIFGLTSALSGGQPSFLGSLGSSGVTNLADVDVTKLQNTAQSVKALFPLSTIKTADDAIKIMISSGTPDYGAQLGISFDDPVKALNFLAQELYPRIKADLQKNDPQTWQRYLNLATKPVGISCEYCCGVGPVGITKAGELTCGCAHNPAVHAITMYLMKYTKMTDAEVLREALRWKSLWFPKDMVGLAVQIAGGDTSSLSKVPGMVGGC